MNLAYTEKDKREHIRELQHYLRYLAFHNEVPMVIPDGIYGKETKSAVMDFQKQHGILPTGDTDNETWDKIVYEYNLISPYYKPPDRTAPFTDSFAVIKHGDNGDTVFIIQIMLDTVSKNANSVPRINIDGFYGDQTENAIKKYQSLSGLSPTGETDIKTWNMLSKSYNSLR